jgi:hypothetical protein
MSVFHENMLIGASGQVAAGGISRSLRFNSADSAYLSRTPASAGNRTTFTWAGWLKRGTLSGATTYQQIFSAGTGISARDGFFIDTDVDDTLAFYSSSGLAGTALMFRTNAVLRDPSAWYHIVLAIDTTQATAANRVKLYVNGVEQSFATTSYPSQNATGYINSTATHNIGAHLSSGEYLSGCLADVFFIDGSALTPSSFTETDATTGQLVEKAYTGSYGTNGFHLEFADNSAATATTLGKDTSGNGNNWTPNNLSVTAGAGNDSLVDVPTNGAQTDTGVGGEVRGNYATFNPLNKGQYVTLSDGNLQLAHTSSFPGCVAQSTIGVSSGKWYCEFVQTVATNGMVGLNRNSDVPNSQNNPQYAYFGANGNKYEGASASAYGASWTTNDVIGVALDADNGTLVFYKNGVSQGTAFSGLTSGPYFFAAGSAGGTMTYVVNFGQRAFAYTAPSGFKALCTANLPAPLVTKPNTVFDTLLYTGNGSARSITGLGFNPDLVWIKERNAAADHALYDAVRGVEKRLESNTQDIEVTSDGGVTAFNSDGFSLGTLAQVNTNNDTYVAWAWDAGSSTVTNNSGSITGAQVRANATAGFSVVAVTKTGTGTVGHGLGVKPELIILKSRADVDAWYVHHSALAANQSLFLNTTGATATSNGYWNNTLPTSTVFSVGSAIPNSNLIVYCFAPVVGLSAYGSYTGNGSSDGPFVYTGFRPRFLMIKVTTTTNVWLMLDAARDTYNVVFKNLNANSSDAENTLSNWVDLLSNGFKIRNATDNAINTSNTYIYAAFAESPFNYARAR